MFAKCISRFCDFKENFNLMATNGWKDSPWLCFFNRLLSRYFWIVDVYHEIGVGGFNLRYEAKEM